MALKQEKRMPFSEEDKALLKIHLSKGYGAEFPMNNWTKAGLDKPLKKLKETGSTDRKRGSGRPKTREKCIKRRFGQERNDTNRQVRLNQPSIQKVMLTSCGLPTKKCSRWPRQEIHSTTDRHYAAASTTKKHIPLNVFFSHDRLSVV